MINSCVVSLELVLYLLVAKLFLFFWGGVDQVCAVLTQHTLGLHHPKKYFDRAAGKVKICNLLLIPAVIINIS